MVSEHDKELLMSQVDWEDLLLAYMHDPVDKSLNLNDHERRSALYASAAVGRDVSREEILKSASIVDQRSALTERLPLPKVEAIGRCVNDSGQGLTLLHPMSAASYKIASGKPNQDDVVAAIATIVNDLDDMRQRFLAIWRLLPDAMARVCSDLGRLPADASFPDHTLVQHADITAGLHAALRDDHGVAYLSFAIGPVQPFIAAARSVRDLWSGSVLLSWLMFKAMLPILEHLGPTAFVYPSLRGNALVDLWLRKECGLSKKIDCPDPIRRMAPSLPNRFVALVPWGDGGVEAEALRQACLRAARSAWAHLADSVRESLDPKLSVLASDWSRSWRAQIDTALEFCASIAPERQLSDTLMAELHGAKSFASGWPDAAHVRGLADTIPASHRQDYPRDSAGRWQAQMETSARLMAAARSVRHVPTSSPADTGPSPGKCTLFGSWEQMGPGQFEDARKFWDAASRTVRLRGVRIRSGERLSAVALTKRFAAPALLARELQLGTADLRFPDTATVAAAEWLGQAEIDPDNEHDWSGRWLHWTRQDQDPDEGSVPEDLWKRIKAARERLGEPPAYYAAIAMDGDEMGQWLAGKKMPALGELMHPKLRGYFERVSGERVRAGLSAKRPVGPALHAAISAALAAFASEIAPEIVASHKGVTIYSGGDDVLALCPLSEALRCARSLRLAFSGRDDPDDRVSDGWRACGGVRRITMGPTASMSAGVVLVHQHADLRQALAEAHGAEARAKAAGRDLLDLTAMRRSGETARAICPWDFVPWLDELRIAFRAGASSRWTYRLRAELPTLSSNTLPLPAIQAEIRRLVDRTSQEASTGAFGLTGVDVANRFSEYCCARENIDRGCLLGDFILLCQSASFMARGRDD